jgi:diaminohydroxyphosphoribosylaminopyrimidine deaminase/5-amino-6-(5-phosphoribosylamino)uracil reductase
MAHDVATRDRAFMGRALELARLGWGQVAPNPMVGAVVVRDGVTVGEGYHARFGAAHAETVALERAGSKAHGSTLYVTLEPCAHHGKTPPCVDAILAAGVGRVVVALRDPNPIAAGGIQTLGSRGVVVEAGLMADEAAELNAAYVHAFSADRPWITLKMAISLDAAIADGRGTTSAVTGPSARAFAHALRAGSDAVAVGMGTVRIDDPLLTVREAPPPRVTPARLVFSRDGALPLTSRLARSAREGPVVVAASRMSLPIRQELEAAGISVVTGEDLGALCRALRALGIRSLLVEGGAGLAGSLFAAGLVDRLILVQAPVVFGAGALPAFGAVAAVPADRAPRWRVIRRVALGDDQASEYAIRER